MTESTDPALSQRKFSGNRTAGHSYSTVLPREYYVSPEIFETEFTKVFSRQWIFAGHISELHDAGDYFITEFAGESIIVVRETAREIGAFLNVCRHRGHRLCSSMSGKLRQFVCPYHQWSFRLDGSLKKAPASPDGTCFDYDDWSLYRVNVDVWGGMIFLWLGEGEAPPLASKLGEPTDDVRRLRPERMKEAFRESYAIKANWKTLLENYLECYHCAGSHPELNVAMDLQAMYVGTESWQQEYFIGAIPLRPGCKTLSMNGNLVCMPMGEFAAAGSLPEGFGAGFGIVPTLTRVIFHVDHAVIHSLRPVSVGEVCWETRWYVSADAVEGRDYDLAALTDVWRATNREDIALCENAYLGVRSRRFVPGPLDPQRESAIPSALRTYLHLMGTGA